MSAFEQLLRKSLAQQGAGDAQTRAKVYQSARAALSRLLDKQEGLTLDQKSAQLTKLEQDIKKLEAEYQSAPQSAPTSVTVSTPTAAPTLTAATESTPIAPAPVPTAPITAPTTQSRAPISASPNLPPNSSAGVKPVPALQPDLAEETARSNSKIFDTQNKKRPYAKLLLWTTLAAFLAIGAWWTIEQQLFVPLSERDGSVPNPERSLDSEDFTPEQSNTSNNDTADQVVEPTTSNDGQTVKDFPKVTESYQTDDKGWINLLDPKDPRGIILDDRGTAEILSENGEQILRLRSFKMDNTSDKKERAIKIEIGDGLAKELAGKTVNVLMILRSSDNDKHRMSVVCAFGALGQCGRRWYQVLPTKRSILIEFDLQKGELQSNSNYILVYTDDQNQGKGVDLYGIKVMAK